MVAKGEDLVAKGEDWGNEITGELVLKWTSYEVLPCSTGKPAQGSVLSKARMGGEFRGERTQVHVCLRPFAVPLELPQHR